MRKVPSTPIARMCTGRHGHFLYPPHDTYVGRSLELYGEYCETEAALFNLLIPIGGTVVEVGANMGALTIPLARVVGDQGMVYAIEPQLPMFNMLCGSLALNGLTHVRPMRVAMGDNTKVGATVRIPLHGYEDDCNFGGVAVNEVASQTEAVPLTNVDSLQLDRLDFLKVDVEGFEHQVLSGARKTIAEHRPMIFVENDRKEHSSALISLLQDMGYDMWWYIAPLFNVENFNQRSDNVFDDLASINMLACPSEKQATFGNFRKVSGPDDWWC